MTKLPRAIRFDESDVQVFPKAASPGEWAVSGAFVFASDEPHDLTGKRKQAFSNGFLGLGSFGWTTFVSVAETDANQVTMLTDFLADYLVESFGAPDRETARPFAAAELEFVADMCRDVPVNTLFAVAREMNEDGEVHETIRKVRPSGEPLHARIWDVVPE